jgi:hypothetical protein
VRVKDVEIVAGAHQSHDHVGAHPAEADHPELHHFNSYSNYRLERPSAGRHELRLNVSLAAATTRSGVNPKCFATTSIGADMPKVCMPSTTPFGPA